MAKDLQKIPENEFLDALDEATMHRADVLVRIGAEAREASSSLDDFDQQKGFISMLAFGDGELDRLMDPDTVVEAEFTVSNHSYYFKSKCVDHRRGIRYHHLAFPEKYYLIQRREFFRIAPPKGTRVGLHVKPEGEDNFEQVLLVNMSLGGLLFHAVSPHWSSGDLKQPFMIRLRFWTGEVFTLVGQVRRVTTAPGQPRDLLIGVQFIDLHPSEEQTLNHIIMAWQREHQREERDV
ncbi:MAG: flagellar brake protein [Candidatus Sumerlaeia bacterium]